MLSKLFLIIGLALSLSACSSLQSTTPNPKTEIPELAGTKSWGFQLEGASAHRYMATSDASARPPTHSPSLQKASSFSGGISYAFLEKLNVGLDLDPVNAKLSLVAKYQFLGSTFAEKQTGNFSGLIHVRTGGGGISKKGDQKGEFGPGGYPWKGSITSQFSTIGLSLGYRFDDKVMAYLGNSQGTYKVSTSITQDAANGDAGGSYDYKDSGKASTTGGGFVISLEDSYLMLGVDYSHVDYTNTTELFDTTYRIGLVLF